MTCSRLLCVLALAALVYVTKAQYISSSVPVTIYYSSLCPDSKKFFKDQFLPAYIEYGNYMQIKFVPFGKSKSLDNGIVFECQRGPEECLGNRVQSCSINYSPSVTQMVSYVLCEMEHAPGSKGSLECAARYGLPQSEIADCVMTGLGVSLQLQAEQDTAPLRLSFIPGIQVGWRFNQSYQDYALNQFKLLICDRLYNGRCPPPIDTTPINTPHINTPPINTPPINTPQFNTHPFIKTPIDGRPFNTSPIITPQYIKPHQNYQLN